MQKYKLQDGGKPKPNPLADVNSLEYKAYLANLRKRYPEAQQLGVNNTYDNKYNGGGVQGVNAPTELQQILNMVDYMKNNNSQLTDKPSNIYRPEWEHNSINNQPITNDAKYGGMKKKKYAVGGQEPPTFEQWLQQTGQELVEGSEGQLYQQYQTFLKTQPQTAIDSTQLPTTQQPKNGVTPSGFQIVKDKSQLDFSGGFKALNFGLDVTNFIGGFVNNIKAKKKERYDYEKAKYPQAKTNVYEDGLNNVPVVYQNGGLVKQVQQKLLEQNYNLKKFGADGVVGSETTAAIKEFQRKNGLTPDGVIGAKTLQKLGLTSTNNGSAKDTLNERQLFYAKQIAKKNGGKFVINDKATFRTYYGEIDPKTNNLKNVNSFETLLGKNTNNDIISTKELYSNTTNFDDNEKRTPIGVYELIKNNYQGSVSYNLGNTSIAMHKTYVGKDDKTRPRLYNNNNLQDNAVTYGCINCQKPDLDKLDAFIGTNKMFAANINSSKYYAENSKAMKQNTPLTYKTLGLTFEQGGEPTKQVVELEKGEVFQKQDGEITKVPESAPKHEDGGSDQKFVFRVLEDTADKRKDINSKLLQILPEEAEQLVGIKIKKPTTHSKLYEEAIKFYTKKAGKIEKGLKDGLEYTKLSKDKYGLNSVDANTEFLNTLPSKGELFDIIFDHQENVKQMFDIQNTTGKNKYGGKYATGGYNEDPSTFGPKKPYKNLPKGYGDKKLEKDYIDKYNALNGTNLKTIDQVQKHRGTTYPELVQDYYKQDGVLPTNKHLKVFGSQQVDFDVADPTKVLQGDNDGLWGNRQILPVKQQFANEEEWLKFVNNRPIVNSNGQQFVYNNDNTYITPEFGSLPNNQRTPAELIKPEREPLNTPLQGNSVVEPQQPNKYTSNSQISGQTKSSRFNEPLRWWDVGGDFMALLQNMERIPVPLEQLDRQPIRYREQSPLPTIQQGQEDFGSIVSQLPQNQLGFANTANLYGKKYSLNNQVFGQYENINKAGYNNTEVQNNNNQFQLDGANLQLRDQFNNRVLQGKAIQQENKMAVFNNLLTKVAQNRAFNRNGNLLMQMTQFFNQFGEHNGNKYNIAPQTAQSTLPQDKLVKKFNATTRKYEYVKAG